VGAGLLIKGFWRLRSVDPGFAPANLMTFYIALSATNYEDTPKQTAFRRELLARLNAVSGMRAAMISDVPFGGGYLTHNLAIDGRLSPAIGAEPEVQSLSVMGDYFRTMQIPLRAGRELTEMDREGQPLVAVVNQQFARQFFPDGDVLGARIDWARRQGPHKWMTIVGVVADVKHSRLNLPVDPAIYAPYAQSDEAWRRWMTLVVRTEQPSSQTVELVKKLVWSLDSQIPVSDVQSMDDLMALSLAQERFNLILLATFAGLALLLAAVGIYGMMTYRVSQRTHEIGVYVALGAQPADVLRMIMRDGAVLAATGIGAGIAGSVLVTRLMTSLLFEVTPTDPAVFSAVVVVLSFVALVACYIPARRALSVPPTVALRCE